MLKKEAIDKIKGYGFDVDKLIAAVKDEKEVDYPVPEFEALTADQLATRDAGKIAEGKTTGETEARKTLVKEVGTRLGFTPKGERIGDLVTDLQAKINATGDEKVKTLQDQVVLLTKDKETLTELVATEKKTASQARFEAELVSHLPTGRGKILRDDERVLMLTRDITFEEVDGKRVAKRNGEILKDPKSHAPLPVPDVVKLYAGERGWDKETAGSGSGGRGGSSDGGGGGIGAIKNMTQAKEQWKKDNPDNPNTMSTEFTTYVNKLAKDDKTFNIYE